MQPLRWPRQQKNKTHFNAVRKPILMHVKYSLNQVGINAQLKQVNVSFIRLYLLKIGGGGVGESDKGSASFYDTS